MEKKCIYCNDSLDIKLHGLTKYCSAKCRNKDYYLKKKSDVKDTNELQSNEKPSETNFRQMNNINQIKKENNFIEPNNDYYTLYLEEKHARQIEQIEKNYQHLCREALDMAEECAEKYIEERKINQERPKEDKLSNILGALAGIGNQIVNAKNKESKIVEM